MNACCSRPIDDIAADRHKPDGQCCLVGEATPAPALAECPVSKTSSRKVQRPTVEHLVRPDRAQIIHDVQYYYCTDPNCPVVYFSPQVAQHITTDDLSVKVLAKDAGDDVNVCYCFDWTRRRLREEMERTGGSTASRQIAVEVKAGRCSCDVKNPKGKCCLGDVNAYVKSLVSGDAAAYHRTF